MLNTKPKNQKGFTIIEVLIVLAIAGLILLIVFLAVPALQRNSRNTQRKNDVAAALGAVNEWSNNNSGKLPANNTEQTAAIGNAKLGTYSGAVTWASQSQAKTTDTDKLYLVTGGKCDGTTGAAIKGTSRQIAAVYAVETGGTAQSVCQDS